MDGVADNSVVVGFGNTLEEATQDHDQNLDDLFQCCKVRNLKLNDKKREIKMQEVPFIGHVATAEGNCRGLLRTPQQSSSNSGDATTK